MTKPPNFSESLSDIFTDAIIADLKRTKRTTLVFFQKSVMGLADAVRCVVAVDGKRCRDNQITMLLLVLDRRGFPSRACARTYARGPFPRSSRNNSYLVI